MFFPQSRVHKKLLHVRRMLIHKRIFEESVQFCSLLQRTPKIFLEIRDFLLGLG